MLQKDTWHILQRPSHKGACAENHHKAYKTYEDLLATVKGRKLKWFGHVTRSDGLTKVILQGTVEGSRRRGRPKKSWIDNIAEWTSKSFAETQAMAHDRHEWRELTRTSVMTPPTAPRGAKGPRQGS